MVENGIPTPVIKILEAIATHHGTIELHGLGARIPLHMEGEEICQ